jgi:two-component system chemotaxis response regulator CheY
MEGLNSAKATVVDMVLTDLNMPVMNGLALIRELRKLPAYRGVPILFLTTESDAELKKEAKAAGATGWITKPFQQDQLVAIVKKVLG